MIRALVEEVKVGKIYTGKVKRVLKFGAFVEVLPGKEGLVHISELSDQRVRRVEDVLEEGDTVTVKCIDAVDAPLMNSRPPTLVGLVDAVLMKLNSGPTGAPVAVMSLNRSTVELLCGTAVNRILPLPGLASAICNASTV